MAKVYDFNGRLLIDTDKEPIARAYASGRRAILVTDEGVELFGFPKVGDILESAEELLDALEYTKCSISEAYGKLKKEVEEYE